MNTIYDIVIIGGGPAGLTAGLYASRARMKTLLLEKAICGGQILVADTVENFPGFPEGVKGYTLGDWFFKQAERFELKVETAEACKIEAPKPGAFGITLAGGKSIQALAIIIATGARWNALNIPGEKELGGRGVSYCATCDGPLFKGKDVVVVGGGDTALEDALFLTKFVNKVTIVHRRGAFRAAKILQERAFCNKKIEVCFNSVAIKVEDKDKVSGLVVKDVNTGSDKTLKCDGVFVLIGLSPNSEIVKGVLKLDDKGYIITDDDMKTSVDGIFASGDVRKKLLRQVVTAAGDGATAATSACHYVDRVKGCEYK